jgi:glycosyltransferase involved in cell wall biosynthesis
MRLLYLNPIGQIGGAERVLLTAIAGVKREQPAAAIRVVMLAEGPLSTAAKQLGAEVQVVPLAGSLRELGDSQLSRGRITLALRALLRVPALGSFLRKLKRAVWSFEPDLVHSNGIKTHLLARPVVPAAVPLVWHVHDFYSQRPVAGWLLRRARSRVRAAIAVSSAVEADTRGVLPGLRIEVVSNAVDTVRFSPGLVDGADLDRRAGLPSGAPGSLRIGLVATYARWKGHLTVIDAAAKLAATSPRLPVRWFLIGGPIYHTPAQFTEVELRKAVDARGLSDRIGFVPFTDDPVPAYRALDVVLHASTKPEPFGLTVAEAMACGRAVVVSAGGGATELFTDGIDALGVRPGNVDQLAAAVERLVVDPALRSNLGAAARATAVERFDVNRYGRELCRVYQSIRSLSLS